MKVITTVLGDIDPQQAGITDMHEHLLYDLNPQRTKIEKTLPPVPKHRSFFCRKNMHYARNNVMYYKEFFENHDVDLAVNEVMEYRRSGGATIVDASASDFRGDAKGLCEISHRTGINIVASTGFYVLGQRHGEFAGMNEEGMFEFISSEIEYGINGTNVRPGIIKTALDTPTSEGNAIDEELMSFRACTRAAAKYDYGMEVHTGTSIKTEYLIDALKIAKDSGVPPDRIQVCHIDQALAEVNLKEYIIHEGVSREPNYERAEALLEEGFVLGFDTISKDLVRDDLMYSDDFDRLRAIRYLIEKGYSSQIVLGQDNIIGGTGMYVGGAGIVRILEFFVPCMRRFDIASETDIRRILIDNPSRILAHEEV